MAKYDFYRKKGNLNYRERAMLEDIAKSLEKNPELSKDISPATNLEELKNLHTKVTSDVAEIISEIKNDEIPKVSKSVDKKPYVDPLNREQPIINDYVMDDKFDPFADYEKTQKARGNFAEPTNYDDAFAIPNEEELRSQKPTGNAKSNGKPLRDNYEMDTNSGSSGTNRRKAKRFATSLVNITTRLLEVGFMWYATKDINENKLAEYEMTGEMDLSLLIELPDGQEATIKEFFLLQIPDIEKASKVNPESKASLIEALTELFIEKNIQPSATYEALIEGVSLLAEQGIKLAVIVQQNNAILNQLRQRGVDANTQPNYSNTPPPPPPPPRPEQYQREEVVSNSMPTSEEDQIFNIGTTNDALTVDLEDLDEEQKNDLSLLNEIETVE